MVQYYEREPLILYSRGEMSGRTRLKAPPPGLIRGCTASDLGAFCTASPTIPEAFSSTITTGQSLFALLPEQDLPKSNSEHFRTTTLHLENTSNTT